MMMRIDSTLIDQVARGLAANAGIVWDLLNEYPGYTRNYWREQARTVLHIVDANTQEAAQARSA